MKTKYFKILISILCLVCLAVFSGVAAGCAPEDADKTIAYTASALADGTVGTAYTATVATATGAEGIKYALKSGSTLPAGLTLAADGSGAISGTPTEAAAGAKFTVVASAEGATSAEAEFTITVKAKQAEVAGYVMEAEYANLEKLKNIAGSFTPRTFIQAPDASNGMCLGDLGQAGNTIEFDFMSTAAGPATLYITMRSSIASPFELEPDVMQIILNDTEVSYDMVTLPNGSFTTFGISVQLKTDNVLKFVTTDNTKMVLNNCPVMPNFDCVTVKTDATVSWTPNLDNEDIY